MDRKTFLKIYWKIERIVTPSLQYSQAIYEDVLNKYLKEKINWLDLGCGHNLLPKWRFEQEKAFVNRAKVIVGIDYDYLSLIKHKTIKNKLCGDITKLPFPDNTFDLITSNMVFEHLENPEKQLQEISRVLSKGGMLIFHTPNKFGYSTLMAMIIPESIKNRIIYILQGRKEDDVFPAFYRINSISRIVKLAKLAGLDAIKLKLICSSAQLVIIPFIVIFELIWIKLLMSKLGKPLRTNIIAILKKP